MTRKQLVKKICSLLKQREYKIKVGPREYIFITVQWLSDVYSEIVDIKYSSSWRGLTLNRLTVVTGDLPITYLKLDISKWKKFDNQIKDACAESDRQAKAAKINKYVYFQDVLLEEKWER